MLKRINIANLKSYRGEASFDLAPITLVYGANSSGKTAFIQAIGLLRQSLLTDGPSVDGAVPALTLRGDYADLSTYLAAVTEHLPDRQIYLGLSVSIGDDEVEGGLLVRYDREEPGSIGLVHARLGPGEPLIFVRGEGGLFELAPADFGRLADIAAAGVADEPDATSLLQDLPKELRERSQRDKPLRFLSTPDGHFPAAPLRNQLNPSHDQWFVPWMTKRLSEQVDTLQKGLSRLSHLGPMRSSPSRIQTLTGSAKLDVGHSGEHTIRLLRDDSQLVKDVNAWLSRLHVNYQISVDDVNYEIPGGAVAAQDTTSIDDQNKPESDDHTIRASSLPSPEAIIGDVVVTSLRDSRNAVLVTPQDVGFGVSQVLPVVVQLLVNENSTILVEQPEVHIHPRLQAELGDLIIESVFDRNNQVIVETHSEHLMLRIQRRFRTKSGPHRRLATDDVSVLFIDQNADGFSHPIRLRLSGEGYFEDDWPDGFFVERVKELYGDLSVEDLVDSEVDAFQNTGEED